MNSIQAEARGLLPLLKNGATVEEVRRSIAPGPGLDKVTRQYRYQIGLEFDSLVLRLSMPALRSGRVRLLNRANGVLRPSPTLEGEILRRLRAGESIVQVARVLHLMESVVRRLSKRHGLASRKFGVGRRFTDAQLEDIATALRSGLTSVSVQKQFHVSAWTVLKVRRQLLNDHTNRRFRRSWDMDAVKCALAQGKRPSDIERTCGIGHQVLWKLRRKLGDLQDWRCRNRRILTPDERARIAADIQAGLSQRAIAKKYHLHTGRVHCLQVMEGFAPGYRRFTAEEINEVHNSIRAGQSNLEIARRHGCSPGAISTRRKKLNAVAPS